MGGRGVAAPAAAFGAVRAPLPRDDPRYPPYFALLGRAFVTLEGIALQGDPDYAIIQAAYPFVSRKLLSSDRPAARRAPRGGRGAAGAARQARRARRARRDGRGHSRQDSF